jgi:PAS domain S-box-containing protein
MINEGGTVRYVSLSTTRTVALGMLIVLLFLAFCATGLEGFDLIPRWLGFVIRAGLFLAALATGCMLQKTIQPGSRRSDLELQAKHETSQREPVESSENLQKLQERCEQLARGSNECTWDWDLVNNKIVYSGQSDQQPSFALGKLDIGRRLVEQVYPYDIGRVMAAAHAHLQRKAPYDIEYRVRQKNGDFKWIRSRGQAVWDERGRPIRFRGSYSDVTSHVDSDELLKESEIRFRQMAENINEIFWITDARGATPVYVSPAYERIFGRTVESLFRNPHVFFEATHPDDRDGLAQVIRKQRTVEQPCEIEYRIMRPNGEVRWLWARLCSMVDANGKIYGLCGVTNDITDRKESEKRVSEFYSTVSHELRTPLTSIRGALGLIQGGLAGEVSAKASSLVKMAGVECDRLIRLINDILDIRKIAAGMLELRWQSVAAESLVRESVENLRGMSQAAGVRLVSQIIASGEIECDKDRLIQVLTNLISNAIKFSKEGTEVNVLLERVAPDSFRFAVKDQGCGIPKKELARLFGMFQQVDSSDSREKGGTGLGLAISKAIIEQHGGQIGVVSEVGVGSEFWFELGVRRH